VRLVEVILAIIGGLAIWRLGLWAVRLLATPQEPAPDPDEVMEVAVAYRCSICGMRLVVTHAADEDPKAPRHCREEMDEE
jgi:hypothetical protein